MDTNVDIQPQQDLVTALQATNMLAAIRIKRLGLGRADKAASAEVEARHQAQTGVTRLVVNRLAGADEQHKAIVSLQNEARDQFNRLTLSWGGEGDGWRLLPNANFNAVLMALNPLLAKIKEARDAMAADVDAIIQRAQQGIGTLNVAPPTAEEILNSYQMTVEFQPLPDGSRFKGLPEQTIEKLTSHIAARARGAWETAQADATGRVAQALEHMVDRLTAYQQRLDDQAAGKEVGRAGVFHDTLIENIQELAQLLPTFNAVNDPRLAQLSEKLSALAVGVTGETLRADERARNEAVARAKDMLDVLAVWKVKP